jgi:hypothetical protein
LVNSIDLTRLGSTVRTSSISFSSPVLHLDDDLLTTEGKYLYRHPACLVLPGLHVGTYCGNDKGAKLELDLEIPFACTVHRKVLCVPAAGDFEEKEEVEVDEEDEEDEDVGEEVEDEV